MLDFIVLLRRLLDLLLFIRFFRRFLEQFFIRRQGLRFITDRFEDLDDFGLLLDLEDFGPDLELFGDFDDFGPFDDLGDFELFEDFGPFEDLGDFEDFGFLGPLVGSSVGAFVVGRTEGSWVMNVGRTDGISLGGTDGVVLSIVGTMDGGSLSGTAVGTEEGLSLCRRRDIVAWYADLVSSTLSASLCDAARRCSGRFPLSIANTPVEPRLVRNNNTLIFMFYAHRSSLHSVGAESGQEKFTLPIAKCESFCHTHIRPLSSWREIACRERI